MKVGRMHGLSDFLGPMAPLACPKEERDSREEAPRGGDTPTLPAPLDSTDLANCTLSSACPSEKHLQISEQARVQQHTPALRPVLPDKLQYTASSSLVGNQSLILHIIWKQQNSIALFSCDYYPRKSSFLPLNSDSWTDELAKTFLPNFNFLNTTHAV